MHAKKASEKTPALVVAVLPTAADGQLKPSVKGVRGPLSGELIKPLSEESGLSVGVLRVLFKERLERLGARLRLS